MQGMTHKCGHQTMATIYPYIYGFPAFKDIPNAGYKRKPKSYSIHN
jgi:hypothetical protein